MDWEETVDRYGYLIEERLSNFMSEVERSARAYHPFIERVYGDVREYVLRRGKRLASCSTLLTYTGYGGDVNHPILDVCVGVELYRHSILVHDDLVDEDAMRRGAETFHKTYGGIYDTDFGERTAVLVGDLLYALSLQSILASSFEAEKLDQVLGLLVSGYRQVNESQILDLLFEYAKPDVDEWSVMASKRAASLFSTSILVGAVLGDAPRGELETLRKAASHIGYCFDIQDDIIDMYAKEEDYGRRPGGDLIRRKKPLHMIYTFQMAGEEELKTLTRIADRGSISSGEMGMVKSIIEGSGALDKAKDISRRHASKAIDLLSETGLNEEVKAFFSSLIEYVEESLTWYR